MDVYFIGWGGLALINAALANIDGRSPLSYFAGSLLFGPLVTLLLASTREEARGERQWIDLLKGRGEIKRPVVM